jgi:TolA-binding protein
MPLTAADWEEIEHYADGTLSATESAAIEARIASDAALQAALAEHRALVAGIRADGRETLRRRLQRLNDEMGPPQEVAAREAVAEAAPVPPLRVSWRAQWGRVAAAASLAAVLGVGALVMLRRPDPQALAMRYGLPDPGLPVLMGSEGPASRKMVNQAMNAYKLGEYETALAMWQQLPNSSIGADTLLYYTGIFQYNAEQPAEAAIALARVQAMPASAFKERADYYFALALWAQGRNQEAQEVFARLIAQGNHPYADAAREAMPHVTE